MLIMTDNWRKRILFLLVFITSFYSGNGCWMEGVDIWALQVGTSILDIHRGDVFNRETRDIEGITSYSFFDALNGGPYLTVTHSNNRFIIATNDEFENYEENETLEQMSVTVNFRCTGGTTGILVFVIVVEDTNNNAPQFLPSNDLAYTIYTPTPPGTTITGCFDGIVVRDIDLTTQRIDFTIEENPYFKIEYDAVASTTAKEFIGIIKTTAFIRALPEPITLTITATDVDLTDDPPLSTTATVTITADTEFEFPEEPVFAQAFFIAYYTDGNQLVLPQPITLQSGFHDSVQFSLEGEYYENFALAANGNQVSITVVTPLPATVLREHQIFLVVRADREYTSGDSATIVVQLPEEVPLEFERAHYEGRIENNILRAPELTLVRGYEGETVNIEVFGEYASFFTPTIQGNTITLSMETLTDIIINENNVISVEIVASTEYSIARSILTLEIIKDDNVTPVFNRPIYTGSYNTETGLTLEQIVFDQGYDESVELSLEGDHAPLFTISQAGPIITLITAGIPPTLFSQQQILLTLEATKPRTVGATAAIVITLPAARQLAFEDATYRGTLQDNNLSLEPIVLSTGYDENVVFSVQGEHANYFTYTVVQNRVTINIGTSIPQNIVQENNLIILTVEASGLNAISTTTSVLVDIIKEDITTPVFSRNIYYGTYEPTSGVNIENINLAQGYDNDVTFDLYGDYASYFQISVAGNNLILSAIAAVPEDVILNEKVFLLNVVANKHLTVGAHAAILIRFPPELTEATVMRFAQNTYEAELENDNLRVDNIVLSTGYQANTEFLLTGDYSSYFSVLDTNNEVSLSLVNPLPIDDIDSTFIVLEVEARRARAISVWTSIVIDIIKEEIPPLIFSRSYYQGVYTEETDTLTSMETISLAVGYDETVDFHLEGDLASLFSLTTTSSNTLTVATVETLPSAVIEQYNQILFAVVATKPDAIDARAAISINIDKITPVPRHLQFAQNHYIGTIEENVLTLGNIILEGYSDDIRYDLSGDYDEYFQLTTQNGVTTLQLLRDLPLEVTDASNVLIYTLEATTEEIRAHTTIILEIIKETSADITLAFEDVYYIGSYSIEQDLVFNAQLRLTDEPDVLVTYSLDGSQAEWFEIVETGNAVSLIRTREIPTSVVEDNSQLIFAIKAESPGLNTATATIVITIIKESTNNNALGFDQITYVGSVQNIAVTLEPITLVEGYTQGVTFTLQGGLADYFVLTPQAGGVVSVTLPTAIPDQLLPANRIIVLEILASAPPAVPAYATIVLEVIVDDDQPSAPQLVFDATYYTGSYSTTAGLAMNTPIVLAQGYDESVEFTLDGEQAQWFDVEQAGNSIILIVSDSIPVGVLASNRQLVFVIAALRSGSDTARATIVVTLTDEYTTDSILGFDQVTYTGTLQNTAVTLEPITLVAGYTQGVTFTLQGGLADYFVLTPQAGGVVSVTLPTAIPDQLLPANRIIVLEILASAPPAVPAYATIVLEVIVDDDQPSAPQLVFDATYYTGSYSTTAGLAMNTPIVLAQGYDESVEFTLEGEQAQWFDVVQAGNSIILIVSDSIPVGVLASNRQLVFVIAALRSGSDTARATIVVTLTDEYTTDSILGFDQVTYTGTLQNTAVTLEPITLVEGYTQGVTFTLQGGLADYFVLTPQAGGVVSVTLPTAIPDQLLPANRIIVLEILASAPPAVPAYATIVLEVIVDDDQPSAPQLVFDATYYTGSYSTTAGLAMNTPIVLAQGYDESVEFTLEGEQAQWFDVVQAGNSIILIVSDSIPVGVLASNRQLVFVIAALQSGSDTARATIVVTLTDEYTTDSILGFDQVTYTGTLQNTAVTLEPITLVEGYTQGVTFTLQGGLADYFVLTPQAGGVVSVTLPTAIPDQLLPANRIIVLEILASAPPAVPAYATIVLEVIVDDDQPSAPQLVFDATYYTGSYSTTAGLAMNTPIVLAQGYDESVEFTLEGEQAQWFDVVQAGNSIILIVSDSIPVGVLASNRQLVFVIAALRSGSDIARATIVVTLTDEYTTDSILGFDQVTYTGTLQNTAVTLEPITLVEGYTQGVTFTLQGGLADYFVLTPQAGGVVSVTLPTAIPDQLLPANRIIVLEILASAPLAVPAYATIVLEVIVDDDQPSAPRLVFDATYYTGSYSTTAGLAMNTPIVLAQGYDESVEFTLEGEQAQWFDVVQAGNSIILIVSDSIPVGVLASNRQLVFVIAALRSGSDTARATIVVTLTDEYTTDSILGFDQVTYTGTLQNTAVTLEPITLVEGYTQGVTFTLQGGLADYFVLTPQAGGVVSVTLPTAIPDQLLPANRIIVLEILASAPPAVPAYATIVLEVIVDDDQPSAPQLVFDATYYTGSYSTTAGLAMNTPIVLAQGYDESVEFTLEGEQAQWFDVFQAGNSIILIVSDSIPVGVLASNRQLVFVIAALRSGSDTARATIVVTLTDEYTTDSILGFDQVTYTGTLQNTAVTLEPITLVEGYTQGVTFTLQGGLADYFVLTPQAGGVVSVTLPTTIPDQLLPANRIIVLEILASAPPAVPAYATIVLEVIVDDDQPSAPQLVFDATYYTGSYSTTAGLAMNTPIVLAQGYDESVEFTLEGEQAQWFDVVQAGNSIILIVSDSIPVGVLASNRQLVFVIAALRSGSDTARATIVVTLTDEYTTDSILGFDQVTYTGTLQNTAVTLEPITLVEGYTQGVTFTLQGGLADYFVLTPQAGGVVSVTLPTAIPDQLLPANRIIVLEILASAPPAVPAYATIVLEVIVDDDQPSAPQLVFDATYYTGSYSTTAGLAMNTPIVLAQGYDESVEFTLEGEQAQWFDVVQAGNSIILIVSDSIPVGVLASNRQLVFVIAALRSGSDTARATIVVTLTDEYTTDSILGFDQVTYTGTLQNTAVTLEPITLVEGYTQGVTFTLQGGLADYFVLTPQAGGVVRVTLPTAIPDQLLPANRIIVLEILASAPPAVPAYATIVLEVIVDDDQPSAPQLVFDATYYTGSYSTTAGLAMNTPIVLAQGYDESVEFTLEGEQAQWFDVVQAGNSIILIVSDSIPVGVLASNRQLVFVIAALRSGSDIARATIVVTLTDEYTTDSILGFDQVTYTGTLQNTAVTLEPITLVEGYTQGVTFTLQGGLADYFVLTPQAGGVVSVTLPTAIPDQLLPANRIIVLEILASAPPAVPAYATIVLEVIVDDDQPSAPQLVFDATYYTGSYSTTAGLAMNTPIVLAQGYDESVEFTLEGEQAQWFDVVQAGNSIILIVSDSIPVGVLASNRQLVFVIAALRSGSDIARATIVVTLTDEYTTDSILGFDQVTYTGTLQNTAVTLEPITLVEGYTQGVTFTLQGGLADYFVLTPQAGGVVSVTLPTTIPDQLLPANRIIVLEILASAPPAVPAYATIVLEVIVDDDQPSAPQLVFDATYYTGSYSTTAGLAMNTPIVLAQGYDESVEFTLEGEQAQWFDVFQAGNSIILIVSDSIPVGVLASNRQLVFVIAALRSGSDTARATIVVTLTDEYTTDSILGFDQVTYTGTLQNTAVTLEPITLVEGYTQGVTFTLQGGLADYFVLTPQAGGVVSATLPTAIPDQLLPANRIIVLEILASAPPAVPAYATIVLEVIVDDDQPSAPQLVFDATYYTGSYSTTAGLAMNTPIVLAQGYDESVEFTLEGEQAQWFDVVQAGNSIILIVSDSIPVGVLASNRQLVFVIAALRSGSDTARATIVVTLTDEYTTDSILGFDQVTYTGTLQNTAVTLEPITLVEGYTQGVTFTLQGGLADYFVLTPQAGGVVSVTLPTAIPDQLLPANRIIVLEILASAPPAVPAYATIVLEVIVDDDQPSAPQLVFDATYYTGSYSTTAGLAMNTPIVLAQGYDESVEFTLEGEQAQWFDVVQAGNSIILIVSDSIPVGVLASNRQLVFVIAALRSGSDTARATIVVTLTDEYTTDSILGFDQVTYTGTLQNTAVTLEPITLVEGYTQGVTFTLQGGLADYFVLTPQAGGVVSATLPTAIPDQLLPANRIIVLEILASAPPAVPAYATIVLEVIVDDDQPSAPQLVFDATYYTGSYSTTAGLAMNTPIVLAQGYDESVEFTLEGEQAQWFDVVQAGNSIILIVSDSIPVGVLASNRQLVFVIAALRSGSDTARATIVVTLTDEYTTDSILGFDQVTYTGTLQNTAVTLEPITLVEGYTQGVTFTLQGGLADYFVLTPQAGGVVSVTLPTAIPDQLLPANRIIVLEILASAPPAVPAYATIVLEVIVDDDQPSAPQLVFDATYYTGSYSTTAGLAMNTPIGLAQGYDESVEFTLEGEQAQWFDVVQAGNSIILIVSDSIPVGVLASNRQLVFVIAALRSGSETARATVVISLSGDDVQTGDDVSFERLIYEGIIQLSTVQHESIIISNYNGADVQLHGAYASLFVARVADGVVTVQASGSLTLPDDVTQVPLELHAAEARAVLLLNVLQSDVPVLPSVTFSSPSYVLNVNVAQTGYVGRVLATADNGEALVYSLTLNDAHLETRLSISSEGQLYMSAPANSGVYTFQVIATTVITQAEGFATVYLSVAAITVCGEDDVVVPPLIILDRDEEEPHNNLVVLNTAQYQGCHFTLTNRWPLDQNWLYVDENGLHSRAIDREHESIAFMALSQVQVELILHCESDNLVRTKRSQRTDWLGPYDYGTSKWILSESIPYNARRSFVNLIVNDINDNAPIFVGKELEPIAVGYPVGEIEERILPRSLAELQATDADIGINAALRYSSEEEVLAVAPTTGFVHVRNGAQLQNNQILTVSATDQNGEGLTGEIQLIVKLLDLNNIVVVTIENAFLDDEQTVLAQLSEAVGYEIKALRSVVISDDFDQDEDSVSRNKRETDSAGASLLLYVYGLVQREPVAVDRLTTDINNNAAVASVISTVSLEDHLEPVEIIISERDIGLLVATIVLSVLLFIIIVLIAIWFFLRWRKNRNYDEFSDENSIASGRGSVEQLPKPDTSKPRLNIEELKRSERRLQDMLNSPIAEIAVEPRRVAPPESVIDLTPPEPTTRIVIQSIDKLKDSEDTDDEYGEVSVPRRKSVVTFNENVEKIIHVEDDADTSSQSGYEIYKL